MEARLPVPPEIAVAKPATRARRRGNQPSLWLIYGLLLLPVGFLVIFNYVPAISAFYHSFTAWDIGAESTWIGLSNFYTLFHDDVFRRSLVNLLKLGSFVFVVNMTVPFVVAEMIFHLRSERWSYWCRVAVVLPMIVPGVVVYLLWFYIYSDAGILTELLTALGRRDWVYGWLSHPKTALWAVAFVGFPFAYGVPVLIYYAGLANMPTSVLEAAEIDGMGPLARIGRIHIPLIMQQIKLLVIITVIAIVNGFEVIYILTQDGGPGFETMVPGLHMYHNGFTYQRMGYACAIGLVMLLFLLFFTIAFNRLVKAETHDPGR
jgi:ABC-type sugar transport system permease subunit